MIMSLPRTVCCLHLEPQVYQDVDDRDTAYLIYLQRLIVGTLDYFHFKSTMRTYCEWEFPGKLSPELKKRSSGP